MSTTQNIPRPEAAEYHPSFGNYVRLVNDADICAVLEAQSREAESLLSGLTDQQSLTRHAPYTWSIKQVIGHVIDAERVFGYRAMRIARGDATPLASFDDVAYAKAADFDRCPIDELLDEFQSLRRSHVLLLRHLPPEAWLRKGVVIDHAMSVRAMAYVIAGHAKHHFDILHKRLAR